MENVVCLGFVVFGPENVVCLGFVLVLCWLSNLTFASVGLADTVTLRADGEEVDLHALFPGTPTIRSISVSQKNWPGKVDFTVATEPTRFAKVWDICASFPDEGDGVQLENIGAVPIPELSTLLLWCLSGVAVASVVALRRLAASR